MSFEKRENAIKFNSKKRLIAIPLLVFLLIIIFNQIFLGVFSILLPAKNFISLGTTINMILTVVFSLFVITKFSKIKLIDLGLTKKNAFRMILIGAVSGLVTLSLVTFLINLLNGGTTSYNFKIEYLQALLTGLIFFIFQGTYEELIFRAYFMPHFSKVMGVKAAIILLSLLFTLLHGLNPGMSLLPIINLFLASLVFSLAYYKTANLWLVGLAHGIWNYAQGFIYGTSVSGEGLEKSLFKTVPNSSNPLISGEIFGFEGSIVTTGLAILLIIGLLLSIKRNPRKESFEN